MRAVLFTQYPISTALGNLSEHKPQESYLPVQEGSSADEYNIYKELQRLQSVLETGS